MGQQLDATYYILDELRTVNSNLEELIRLIKDEKSKKDEDNNAPK